MNSQESENKAWYRDFCSRKNALPVFMQAWYLDAVCEGGEWEVILIREGEELIAAYTYFVKQKMGFKYITMPPFVKVMGPYISSRYRGLKKSHQLLEQLITQLPKVDCIKQDFHYSVSNWLPFYWSGFKQSGRYTYLIDISDMHIVYGSINRNMKRNIEKAKSQLRLGTDLPIEEFYAINKMSFDRQGISIPYSLDQLKKHDEALAAQNARKIFYAIDRKRQIHSASYLIWDQNSSYYHLSGDNPDLRQSGAGIFLIWEAIRYSCNQLGLQTFDFEGSMLKPVEQIRRQFGAKQQHYARIWQYNSKLYHFIDWLQGKAW